MSENKQTSINWLIAQLQKSKDWYRVLNEINFMTSAEIDILEQAREMYWDEIEAAAIISIAEESTSDAHKKEVHRQEIIAAYKAAMHTQYLESFTMDQQGHVIHKADDYYNKTYNTK